MADEVEAKSSGSPPKLRIEIKGPKVGKARLSASDMVEIINRTQQVLRRIGQVLYGEASKGKGRKKKDIEDLCELFVTAWEPGSAIATLELAEPPPQMHIFGYIGEESLKAFINGMEDLPKQETTTPVIPQGFDEGV